MKKITQAQIDSLALEIFEEFNGQKEGITMQEAQEMARMELNAKNISRYEKSDTPRKKSTRERKADTVKIEIIKSVAKNLSRVVIERDEEDTDLYAENISILKPEKEITFTIGTDNYSISLTKHRPPKN